MRGLRRRLVGPASTPPSEFALEELHALLAEGKLTRDEFERARDSVLSRRSVDADEKPRRAGFEPLETRDHI